MVDYYPLLIEACIEFKRFSRQYLAKLKSKSPFLLGLFSFPTYSLLLHFGCLLLTEQGAKYVEKEDAR